jgi:hypothetical protein
MSVLRTYTIDFYEKIAKDLLPHFLQQKSLDSWVTSDAFPWVTVSGDSWVTGAASRHLDWLKALMEPLADLNLTFRTWLADVRYAMYMTGQVVYMEHYLNDIYDNSLRRIYIDDGNAGTPFFLYNKEDGSLNEYIYNKSELETAPVLYNQADYAGQVDFIVVIPWANIPSADETIMSARIKKYKLAGKRFEIQVTGGGPAWPY